MPRLGDALDGEATAHLREQLERAERKERKRVQARKLNEKHRDGRTIRYKRED